ncbi:hypothetical protein GCM10009651_20510 [Microbacterium natoriense]
MLLTDGDTIEARFTRQEAAGDMHVVVVGTRRNARTVTTHDTGKTIARAISRRAAHEVHVEELVGLINRDVDRP